MTYENDNLTKSHTIRDCVNRRTIEQLHVPEFNAASVTSERNFLD